MMTTMNNKVSSVTMDGIMRIYASDHYAIVKYIDGIEIKTKYDSVKEANDACLDLVDQVNKYLSSKKNKQEDSMDRIDTALERISDQLSPDLIDMVWGRK